MKASVWIPQNLTKSEYWHMPMKTKQNMMITTHKEDYKRTTTLGKAVSFRFNEKPCPPQVEKSYQPLACMCASIPTYTIHTHKLGQRDGLLCDKFLNIVKMCLCPRCFLIGLIKT